MSRWARDEEGAWASASRAKRAIGLLLGLALLLITALPVLVIVAWFLNQPTG